MRTHLRTDCLCILLLGLIQIYISLNVDGFEPDNFLLACISVMPAIVLYALTRFFLPPLLSMLLLSGILAALSFINRAKTALTNVPLVWEDLTSYGNFSIVLQYVAWDEVAAGVLFLGLCYIAYRVNSKVNNRGTYHYRILLCVLLMLFIHFPYDARFGYADSSFVQNAWFENLIDNFRAQASIQYNAWDWSVNVRNNGLMLHLVQTREKKIPRALHEEESRAFARLMHDRQRQAQPQHIPKNIIIIMCESCWHDSRFFTQEFAPLEALGFIGFRTISPVYGGGTVNATFEFLTGLPARGELSGIIYQEYASYLSHNAHTLPRYLRKSGYRTVAAHNFNGHFWRRNIVNPRLGFDQFISLEDMENKFNGRHSFPDDQILFDAAEREITKSKQPLFLYLTTVFTHGGYEVADDEGEGDYRRRLGLAIQRIVNFAQRAKAIEPDTLILVFGDHKPALTKFFYKNRVINADQFARTGEQNEDFLFKNSVSLEKLGDVPAYIYYPNRDSANEFVVAADRLPIFCLSQVFDEWFTRAELPAFVHADKAGICSAFRQTGYNTAVGKYPAWLYSLSILDQAAIGRGSR